MKFPGATLVLVAAALACRGTPAPASKQERARACAGYQLEYWRGVAEAEGAPPAPDHARYLCAELYSKPACPAAWPAKAASAAAIAVACAGEYCPALPAKPTLCRQGFDTLAPRDAVQALVELDRAILLHELGDRDLAQVLSARMRLLLGGELLEAQ